jgi:hypothetical protein
MADVPVVFVNTVAVSGFCNGICNFAFSTAQFLPAIVGKIDSKIELSEIITANLRMDLLCAQQLHDSLAKIIAQQTSKPDAKDVN